MHNGTATAQYSMYELGTLQYPENVRAQLPEDQHHVWRGQGSRPHHHLVRQGQRLRRAWPPILDERASHITRLGHTYGAYVASLRCTCCTCCESATTSITPMRHINQTGSAAHADCQRPRPAERCSLLRHIAMPLSSMAPLRLCGSGWQSHVCNNGSFELGLDTTSYQFTLKLHLTLVPSPQAPLPTWTTSTRPRTTTWWPSLTSRSSSSASPRPTSMRRGESQFTPLCFLNGVLCPVQNGVLCSPALPSQPVCSPFLSFTHPCDGEEYILLDIRPSSAMSPHRRPPACLRAAACHPGNHRRRTDRGQVR